MGKKIGILGSSFDPIHLKHLIIAQDALEQLQLDKILFIPVAKSPLKPHSPNVSDEDRLRMVKMAIEGMDSFELLDWEIKKGGISYTIDTVKHLQKTYPADKFFWIIGEDQLEQLPQWKNIDELKRLIDFIVVKRPGHSIQFPTSGLHFISSHQFDISSTEIRQRLRDKKTAYPFLPEKVHQYINQNHLYGR
ncbi:MAG: nicotinate (nicotinamide) nucleotide adenylyltransferase [Verrucomicrobia bacterium CG1_02_43_26]|nr:MAG: nicotinate (nicotinamide) nucleotide adenylyltransferase [Verrucomicrobia bacterium CG1_02_43_26]